MIVIVSISVVYIHSKDEKVGVKEERGTEKREEVERREQK